MKNLTRAVAIATLGAGLTVAAPTAANAARNCEGAGYVRCAAMSSTGIARARIYEASYNYPWSAVRVYHYALEKRRADGTWRRLANYYPGAWAQRDAASSANICAGDGTYRTIAWLQTHNLDTDTRVTYKVYSGRQWVNC